MSAYVDYTYYTGTYFGTLIASSDFSHIALIASALVDEMTQQRVLAIITAGTDTATIDKIKMATCSVADEMYKIQQDGGESGFSSEGVGGNSVNYNQNAVKTLSAKSRYNRAGKLFLGATGLMYPGFLEGEYSTRMAFDDPGDL